MTLAACSPAAAADDLAQGVEGLLEGAQDMVADARRSLDEAVEAADTYRLQDQIEQRQRHCSSSEGTWVEQLEISPCDNGQATLTFDGVEEQQACADGSGASLIGQCVHRDAAGRAYFNDGPSTPPALYALGGLSDAYDVGRWVEVFWEAAVNHDYCYHHNGVTRQLTQHDCDQQMLADLTALCAAPQLHAKSWFHQESCHRHAVLAYVAVRGAGRASFEALNTEVDYPAWRPMHEKLGIEAQQLDTSIGEDADRLLERWKLSEAF